MLPDRFCWRAATILMLGVTLAGCASKRISVTSDPVGAQVIATPIRDGVKGESKLLGATPLTAPLNFAGDRRYILTVYVPHFNNVDIEAAYEPKDETEYFAQLERVSIDVPLITFDPVLTSDGTRLNPVQRTTVAFLDVVERSPTVRAVTRVTGNENRSAVIGRPVLSPTEDLMVYPWITVKPVEDRYVVVKGDTIKGIAAQFGRSVDELLDANEHLDVKKDPKPGAVVRIITPEIYSNVWRQQVGSFARTRVTEEGWRDLYPAFTPDGKQIIFSSNRTSDNPTLWRTRLDGAGGITRITDSQAQDFQPSVAAGPNSSLIAYASIPPGADAMQIWTVHANGALPSQLRQGHSPCVAPDGERLLFLRRDKVTGRMQLWRMSVDGTNETQLTANGHYDILDPQWSPDGKWIVFASNESADAKKTGNLDIWIMAADGSRKSQLTSNASWDDCPSFDRTGRWIYFRSNRGGAWNIWRLEPIFPSDEEETAFGF